LISCIQRGISNVVIIENELRKHSHTIGAGIGCCKNGGMRSIGGVGGDTMVGTLVKSHTLPHVGCGVVGDDRVVGDGVGGGTMVRILMKLQSSFLFRFSVRDWHHFKKNCATVAVLGVINKLELLGTSIVRNNAITSPVQHIRPALSSLPTRVGQQPYHAPVHHPIALQLSLLHTSLPHSSICERVRETDFCQI